MLNPIFNKSDSHSKDCIQSLNYCLIEDLKNIIKSKEATKVEGIAKEVSKKEVGVQHDTTDIMFCHECEYPADDMYDLGGHMVEFHSEGVVSNEINCHFCDETFSTMDSVM